MKFNVGDKVKFVGERDHTHCKNLFINDEGYVVEVDNSDNENTYKVVSYHDE